LKQRIKRTLGQKKGKILICPVCDKDLRLMEEILEYGVEDDGDEAQGK